MTIEYGNIEKLRNNFEFLSEFGSQYEELRGTAEAIMDLIPSLDESEVGGIILSLLIISRGSAAGPKKKYYAVNILNRLESQFPEAYERIRHYHGY